MIRRLFWQLAAIAAGFCVAVVGVDLLAGHGWAAAVIAGVSLAMAAIPEEFPMVYTLYLSLGAWRLARERVLVRNLASVETLGAATVICTDKTGTLTRGRLEVVATATTTEVVTPDRLVAPAERALLEPAVLASEPSPFDPLDKAILAYAKARGIDVDALHAADFVADYPFDPKLKYVSHTWKLDGVVRVAAKGALEGILQRSQVSPDEQRRAIRFNHELASDGMRVIGVAVGTPPGGKGRPHRR